MYTDTHTHTRYSLTYVRTYLLTDIPTHLHLHLHAHPYLCTCLHLYSMHACMHARIYIYIYIHSQESRTALLGWKVSGGWQTLTLTGNLRSLRQLMNEADGTIPRLQGYTYGQSQKIGIRLSPTPKHKEEGDPQA